MTKHFTFKVLVTLEVDMTFDEGSVVADDDGAPVPSDLALATFASEIAGVLQQDYSVREVNANSDSAMLLGSEPQ